MATDQAEPAAQEVLATVEVTTDASEDGEITGLVENQESGVVERVPLEQLLDEPWLSAFLTMQSAGQQQWQERYEAGDEGERQAWLRLELTASEDGRTFLERRSFYIEASDDDIYRTQVRQREDGGYDRLDAASGQWVDYGEGLQGGLKDGYETMVASGGTEILERQPALDSEGMRVYDRTTFADGEAIFELVYEPVDQPDRLEVDDGPLDELSAPEVAGQVPVFQVFSEEPPPSQPAAPERSLGFSWRASPSGETTRAQVAEAPDVPAISLIEFMAGLSMTEEPVELEPATAPEPPAVTEPAPAVAAETEATETQEPIEPETAPDVQAETEPAEAPMPHDEAREVAIPIAAVALEPANPPEPGGGERATTEGGEEHQAAVEPPKQAIHEVTDRSAEAAQPVRVVEAPATVSPDETRPPETAPVETTVQPAIERMTASPNRTSADGNHDAQDNLEHPASAEVSFTPPAMERTAEPRARLTREPQTVTPAVEITQPVVERPHATELRKEREVPASLEPDANAAKTASIRRERPEVIRAVITEAPIPTQTLETPARKAPETAQASQSLTGEMPQVVPAKTVMAPQSVAAEQVLFGTQSEQTEIVRPVTARPEVRATERFRRPAMAAGGLSTKPAAVSGSSNSATVDASDAEAFTIEVAAGEEPDRRRTRRQRSIRSTTV